MSALLIAPAYLGFLPHSAASALFSFRTRACRTCMPYSKTSPSHKHSRRRLRPQRPSDPVPQQCAQAHNNPWVAVAKPPRAETTTTHRGPSLFPKETASLISRFALISDVHVFDREGIWTEDVTDFNLHRMLGLANLVLLRGPNKYDTSVLDAALSDMHSQHVQHLVCAGDVTNIAMESEFALAASVFKKFGPPETMTFCPGNHDIYVNGQSRAQLFQDYLGAYCVSDVPGRSPREDGFPIVQVRGGILFLALNSGLPNTAAGEVGRDQWDAARDMLTSEAGQALCEKARFRVLVQHHPAQNPAVRGTSWIRQIGHGNRDWPRLSEFARRHHFDLVLHGHLHRPYRARLAGSPQTLVYESGSGTLMTDDSSRVARYTVFELDDGELVRTYSRVWNRAQRMFQTLDLPLPLPE